MFVVSRVYKKYLKQKVRKVNSWKKFSLIIFSCEITVTIKILVKSKKNKIKVILLINNRTVKLKVSEMLNKTK